MKHIETSFRTFLNYKLNEKIQTKNDEDEDEEPILQNPDPDGEENDIDDLITEYQKLMNEWKENKKKMNDILQRK